MTKAAKILALFTEVREGEAKRALLLTLNFFLLFTAYYTIKPLREALILSMDGGAELKSNASGYQALAFMILVPLYGAIANRFTGRGILILIYLFLASNLIAFAYLTNTGFAHMGVAFFLWVGVFNLLTISQTWSLCNDIYSDEQGKRLFPLIAFGASSGAVFGPLVFGSLLSTREIAWPMAIAASILVVCAVLVRFTTPDNSNAARRLPPNRGSAFQRITGGFGLLAANPYLLYIAILVLIINFVNTTSEYMLGKLVAQEATALVAAGLANGASVSQLIGAFFGRFFLWVNVIVLLTQLFAVSRIVKHFGVYKALFALPVLALMSYSIILIVPILSIVRIVKTMENAIDYSLNNTAREILFLPVTREEKYKAKFAIDTFFWRGGDALSNVAVRILTGMLGLGITAFAGLNAAVVIIWIFVVYKIKRTNLKTGANALED